MKGKGKKPRRRIRREKRPPSKAEVIRKIKKLDGGKQLADILKKGKLPQTDKEWLELDRHNPFHP